MEGRARHGRAGAKMGGGGGRCDAAAPKMSPDEARVMSRTALPEETHLERQLRPQRLDEYVGQRAAVESLRVSVEAARQRAEPLEDLPLPRPPGPGKNTR